MAAPPPWLQQLGNDVAAQIRAVDMLAPIGCHFYFDAELKTWEVTVFVSRTETVGGPFDGRINASRFSVDLNGLQSLFQEGSEMFHWQALSMDHDDHLGPHVGIETVYKGHKVWIRIPATAPSQFEAGRHAQVYDFNFEDEW